MVPSVDFLAGVAFVERRGGGVDAGSVPGLSPSLSLQSSTVAWCLPGFEGVRRGVEVEVFLN